MNRSIGGFVATLVVLATSLLSMSTVRAQSLQLVVNGQPRVFVLNRPSGTEPHPTVIMLHGGGSNAAREADAPGLGQLAPQNGFAAVFPEGRAGRWNHLPPGKEARQMAEGVFKGVGGAPDDVTFLKLLVADLVRRGVSDPKRIYLVGRAAGGLMALRMACEDAGLFAGLGLLTTGMAEPTGAVCRPAKPLPVLMLNGTADQVMPYAGGTVADRDGVPGRGAYGIWPAERLVEFFRRLNGCTESALSVVALRGREQIELERWARCAGAPVEFYRVAGGGHNANPTGLDVSQALLTFFSGKPASATAPAATPAAHAQSMQLVVDGQPRVFVLNRPPGAEPRPTVIMLHGAGSNAAKEANAPGLGQLAPQNGFAAVFPEGRGGRWNHVPPGKEATAFVELAFKDAGGALDDVKFLRLLVADLIGRGVSDPKRVYLAGRSAGGLMTLRMACEDAKLFAGIGLLITGMSEPQGTVCRPAKPLPVLMLNGTADQLIPYGGGTVGGMDGTPGRGVFAVWPTDRLVEFFRRLNGCTDPAQLSVVAVQSREQIHLERSAGCAGAPIEFYRVVGGSHNANPTGLDVSQALLTFFSGKPVSAAVSGPAAAAAPAATVVAQSAGSRPDDRPRCFSNAIGSAEIEACGRLIASGDVRGTDLVRAHLQRAIIFSRRGDDYDRVIADTTEMLKIEPNNAEALVLRGNSLQRKGETARARADVTKAVQLGPKSALAHNALSVYYNMTGDYDRALSAANESLRINPDGPYGRKNRAESLEGKGELENALADFRSALARDPQMTERAGKESAEAIRRIEQKLAARTAPPTLAPPPPAAQNAPSPPSTLAAVPGRRVALVIGNDRYENLPVLQKAVNDARAVRERLARIGFEVIHVENANRRTMNQKLAELTGKIGRGDTAFFFFAGHGIAIRDTNYLLPVDTPQAREGQEGLIAREAIGADVILDALQDRGAKVSLMVLDACRDNPFKTASSRGVGGTRGLSQMPAPEGVFVLYSAGFGQTALDRLSDNDKDPNSVFTRTFVKLLERPGLSLQELAKITQGEVRKLAASINHVQMPAYYDQVDGTLTLTPK
jgi:poly(3-hydroxybutyrate) depolymerase/tetratricopeptide (TPR) repeat protein